MEKKFEFVDAVESTAPPKPCFTVETRLNLELHEEASNAMLGKSADISFYVLMTLAVAYLVSSVWMLLKSGSNAAWFGIIFSLVIGGAMLYSRLFSQKKRMKRWEQNLEQQFGVKELHLTTELYELNLVQTIAESGDTVDCGYSDLRALRETPNLFMLENYNGHYFFLEKHTIHGGTADELKDFLRAKIGGK